MGGDSSATPRGPSRWARLVGLALAGASAIAALMLLPAVWGIVVSALSVVLGYAARRTLAFAAVGLIGAGLQAGARPAPIGGATTLRARLDTASDWAARRLLPASLAAWIVAMVGSWAPHYLTWPWWADTDHFAVSALAWSRGVLPYRDLLDYNFPGPTYLMWAIGTTAGWGRTWPFQAFDAAWLAAVLVALSEWSRARFGGRAAGLAAGVLVAGYYVALPVTMVAQRDWYTATLALVAILTLQSSPTPGPGRRWAAAGLMAAGLATRPYALLFVPAVALAAGGDEGTARDRLGRAGRWGLMFAAASALAFAPLVAAGIFDDFVRSLAFLRPGGAYNRNTTDEFLTRLASFRDPDGYRLASTLAVVAALAFGPSGRRPSAWAWLLALAASAVYQPLAPIPHAYLLTPARVVPLAAFGFALGTLADAPGVRGSARLLAYATVLVGFSFTTSDNCNLAASRAAIGGLAGRGGALPPPPPGVGPMFDPISYDAETYRWADYLRLLDYIRTRTTPETRVANALRRPPNPPINGPAGRPTPFSHASGLLWLRWMGPALTDDFLREIDERADLVVWAPGETGALEGLDLPGLDAVVRRRFRPEARFGAMEVWRRVPD